MFEIDLLKGKGRPRKAQFKRVVVRLFVLLIPIGVTAVYAVDLQHDRIQVKTLLRTVQANEAQLESYAEGMLSLSRLRRDINTLSQSIEDIGRVLNYRIVTSEVLVELADQLPDEIYLMEMNWRRASQRERRKDPKTNKNYHHITIQRSLRLSLCGHQGADSDTAVQTYIQRLKQSPALRPLIRDIRTISREQRLLEDKNETLYEIELFLNDQG